MTLGSELDSCQEVQALASYDPFLLYPGQDAHNCEELALSSKNIIIVIDGTWDEAQKIVYRNPLLHSIPRISFQRPLTSNYRIRRPPKSTYLSTVESVGHLLTLNAVSSGCAQMIPNVVNNDINTTFLCQLQNLCCPVGVRYVVDNVICTKK